MSTRPSVEFYFGVDAPSSWFAFTRLVEATQRTDSQLVYRPASPIELADLTPVASNCTVAATYARKDLNDWAQFCNLPLRHTAPLERSAEPALRAVLAASNLGAARSFVEHLFEARFSAGEDVTDRDLLVTLAKRAGLDRKAFIARLEAPGTAAALRENDAALPRRGGYTLPSMFVGDALFVGHERLPLVEAALMRAAERPFIAPGEHGRIDTQ